MADTQPLTALVFLKSGTRFLDIADACVRMLGERFAGVRAVVAESYDDFAARIGEANLAITWRFDAGLYARAPRLRAVFTPAAGREWVAADPTGRVPALYGEFHGRLMAEALLTLMLHFNAGLHRLKANQARHVWDRDAHYPMRLLDGQRVLLVGYGHLGAYCAKRLAPWNCSVAGVQRTHAAGFDPRTGVRYVTFATITAELRAADHVVLLLPGTPENRRIFTREHLSAMKPGAFLYNLGRGSVIADEDLVWALENKVIAGAGLDVFEEEPLPPSSRLWDLPNVVVMPHASPAYEEYGALFADELATRLGAYL